MRERSGQGRGVDKGEEWTREMRERSGRGREVDEGEEWMRERRVEVKGSRISHGCGKQSMCQ